MKQYCYTCMREIKQGDYCTECMKPNVPDDFAHHLKPGTILNNKYLVGNCLGEGGFGITYIGRDLLLDFRVAIKEFYPNGYANRNNDKSQEIIATAPSQSEFFNKGKDRFLQEARNIARFVDEPGIVGVREYFECNNTAYIIMDYLDGENLSAIVKKNGVFRPDALFDMILPMVGSLKRMHEAGIIHRDISPDNIMLLKNGTLKLMDFGSARYYTNEEKEMSVMLKQGYAPEEQYRKNGNQGPWTDVYGLCATMYKCITGVTPVDALDRMRVDGLKKPSELGVTIPETYENILMYGLAVYNENRCHDMAELGSLIEKARNNERLAIEKKNAVAEELYKTRMADEQYRTALVDRPYGDEVSFANNEREFYMNTGAAQPAPVPAKKKSSAGLVILIVVLSLLLLGGGGFFLYNYLNSELDKAAANSATQAATEEATEATEPEATEAPQTEKKDDIVLMPNVTGKKLSEATAEIFDLGLKIDTQYEVSTTLAEGYVTRQSIEPARELKKGETVLLYVAKKPAETSAPKSNGSSSDDTLYCCASDHVTLRDRPSRTGLAVATIKSREAVTYISETGEFYYVSYGSKTGYVLKEFFSKDKNAPLNTGSGNSPLKPNDTLYCTASDYAVMWSSASMSSSEVTTIDPREEVTFISADGDYFYVSYKSYSGYVIKNDFAANAYESLHPGTH